MSITTVEFEGKKYPKYIIEGFHSQYIFPIAKKVCKGIGLDIGCGKEEWKFPGAFPVEPKINIWNATYLPNRKPANLRWDYIFSSHCLEHIPYYMNVLEYWTDNINRNGGILFLYLPHSDCEYWKPWKMTSKKHVNQFYPKQMEEIFKSLGYKNIYCSGCDLAFSFAIYGEKR